MFSLIDKSFLDPESVTILQIYQSINESKISPGSSRSPEFSMASFFVVEFDEEKLKLFIGIYFRESHERMLYESKSFGPEDSAEILVQAESFAGDMGFMMDDLRYGIASDEDRKEMIRLNPFLVENVKGIERVGDSELSRTSSISRDGFSQKQFAEAYTRLLCML